LRIAAQELARWAENAVVEEAKIGTALGKGGLAEKERLPHPFIQLCKR